MIEKMDKTKADDEMTFESLNEMWEYVESTQVWKDWLIEYNKIDHKELFFTKELLEKRVIEKLTSMHKKVWFEDRNKGIKREMYWVDFIWDQFQLTVAIDYFRESTDVDISDTQIIELYSIAKRNAFTSHLGDVMDIFNALIESTKIII